MNRNYTKRRACLDQCVEPSEPFNNTSPEVKAKRDAYGNCYDRCLKETPYYLSFAPAAPAAAPDANAHVNPRRLAAHARERAALGPSIWSKSSNTVGGRKRKTRKSRKNRRSRR